MTTIKQTPMFRDLSADAPDPEVTEIESLCMNCHANGSTRLLLTRIPYYKNVVIMSFSCEECGYANNEIQPGGAYAELGVRWKLQVTSPTDMNRQVVKSDYTRVRIPCLDFEIPPLSQKGEVTTVEGLVSRAIAGLAQDQEARYRDHPEDAQRIEEFLKGLKKLKDLEMEWTLELEDITGNCYVENPSAPRKDQNCERVDFERTAEQDHSIGIYTREDLNPTPDQQSVKKSQGHDDLLSPVNPEDYTYEQLTNDEIMQFRTNCPSCNAPCDTNMKLTNIPHFKEVVIMSTNCDVCGNRTNEVKSGGGIEPQGVRFEVRIAGTEDFSRDILKSETCSMELPELQLEVGGRALGGRFTTAEGVLQATRDQLLDSPGLVGDAAGISRPAMDAFIEKLQLVLQGEMPVTIVLDDPAGNSYVQSLAEDPTVPDEGLKITRYDRTYEQNEELGINDMRTEGYEDLGTQEEKKTV